jgi:hypothetical protein
MSYPSAEEIRLSFEDFEKFRRAIDHETQSQKLVIHENAGTCPGECDWCPVRHLEKSGLKDVFVCKNCKGIHICDCSCRYITLARESWVCRISGLEKDKIVSTPTFYSGQNSMHKSIINPLDRASECKKITVGPVCEYKLMNVNGDEDDKASIAQEKYRESVDSILEKIVFNKMRKARQGDKVSKASSESSKVLRKASTSVVSKPTSVVALFESMMSEKERVIGNDSFVDDLSRETKTRTKDRIKNIVVKIKHQFMRKLYKKQFPKTEYQILSILYLLNEGWPGIFSPDPFLKKFMPLKKELQNHQNMNLNRLSKSFREIKSHLQTHVLSVESERKKFIEIFRRDGGGNA